MRFSLGVKSLFSSEIDERNEWIYYATQLFHSLIFTIPIWIVYYQARITPAQISILVAFQYAAQILAELPSGALADLIGRKQTTMLGFAIGAAAFLLFPFAAGFEHFLVLALLIGLSDSFRSGAEEALIYDTYKQVGQESKFAKAYANGNIIYQAGLITSTFLGGFLYALNEHLPYFLYGLSLLIGTALVWRYIEPLIDSETFTWKNYYSQIVTGSKEAFKNIYTKYLSLYYIFVAGITWTGALYFNEYMMVELGFGDSTRGVLSAAMRFINVVVIASVLKNEKLFGWKRTLFFFPMIMMFGYLPGIWLNGFLGLPFVQAAMIAATARWIILAPLTNDAFTSKYRATAISLLSLLSGVVYLVITGASAYVIPTVGLKTMYSLLGITTFITVVPLAIKLMNLRENVQAQANN